MQLQKGKSVQASLTFKSASGKPGRVEGAPVWSTDEGHVQLVVSEDGMSAVVKAISEGTAQITALADADLGPGVRAIPAYGTIEVVDEEAAEVSMDFGTPT